MRVCGSRRDGLLPSASKHAYKIKTLLMYQMEYLELLLWLCGAPSFLHQPPRPVHKGDRQAVAGKTGLRAADLVRGREA